MANPEEKKRKNRPSRDQHDNSGCGWVALDGCFYSSMLGDGCLRFDGGCFDGFSGGCSLLFLPLRWLVILGLMLYGDWDYR